MIEFQNESSIPDEARHENVKVMTDAVHKYGWYRK